MASIPAHTVPVRSRRETRPWNLGALEYLQQCLDRERPLAVIIGERGAGKAMLLRRFLQYRNDGPVAFAQSATNSARAFLESILLQFGLEAHDSNLEDLRNLTMVFVRHQAAKGIRPIIVVENAHTCGAQVLESIELLSKLEIDGHAALLLILTGTRELTDRFVLPRTVDRCDLDELNAMPMIAHRESGHIYGHIEVRLGDNFVSEHAVDRRQMLIGRKKHNDICLPGKFVSRHHAVIISQPIGTYVVDLKSTNGLSVNSEPVRRHMLVAGDVISISNYRLVFSDSAAPQPSRSADEESDVLSQTVAMRRQAGSTSRNSV